MELCSGPTLQWVLDGRGALSEVEASSRAILLPVPTHHESAYYKSTYYDSTYYYGSSRPRLSCGSSPRPWRTCTPAGQKLVHGRTSLGIAAKEVDVSPILIPYCLLSGYSCSVEALAAPAYHRGHTQPTCGARIG